LKRWRTAHAALATIAVLSWATGYVPGGAPHVWLATLSLPLVAWAGWVGARLLLSLRRSTPTRQLNVLFSRLTLLLLVVAAITGVLASLTPGSLARLRALRLHEVTADLCVPTFVAHALLSTTIRARRWRRRQIGSQGAPSIKG